MKFCYELRNKVIRKLAGNSTIVINADIDNERLLYVPYWRRGSLVCDSIFTYRQKKVGLLRRFWNWLW